MSDPELSARLEQGVRALGLAADALPIDALIGFINLLHKWNQTYNLTGLKNPELMVSHHLLDALAVLPFISGDHCLDLGTGAGLPGVVLAMAAPGSHWVLLDSNRKKARFLRQVVLEFGLVNVEIVNQRTEDYRPGRGFDTIVSRAVADVTRIREMSRPLLAVDGVLLAMLGAVDKTDPYWRETGAKLHECRIPGVPSPRHIAVFRVPGAA